MKKESQRYLTVGDVLEIVTINGLAYAQCSHLHPLFGPILRVLPGLHQACPKDFLAIVNQQEKYHVFFLWDSSIDPAIVKIVCHKEIPEQSKGFPLFRDGV